METEYKDMVEYIEIAQKAIKAFADKICPGISYQMSQSEDAIADVAQAIMWGDWKYDPNRKGQISNLSKTQYSYRNQCAIWGIQTYVKKRLKRKTVYLNNLVQDQEMDLTDLLVDERQNEPITQLLDQEKEDLKFQTINDIFDSKLLTQEQKDKVRLYYLEGYSLAKVGKKYGVTREAIRQTLKSCIKKLQGEFV
jgi:RNA polymerase sigma factor (sigma-70 family)